MWLGVFIFAALGALVFAAIAGAMVYRLSLQSEAGANLRRFWPWIAKGLVLPFFLWALLNLGLSWHLQPFMPQVQVAQNSGKNWLPAFFGVVGAGLFAVSSYWAAVTLAWALFKRSRGLEPEVLSDFRALSLTCLAGMALPALGLLWLGGWMTLGIAALAILLPIAGYGPAILNRAKARPMYSAAIARMKFGKYAEAEWEIIRQLENAEHDFDGWLMLAELYAIQFKDLPGAEEIILEICDQPTATPSQVSVALQKLADWHLNIGNDPDAARRALQVISLRMPHSHLAHMAEVRASQLPRTADELLERKSVPPIPLPALNDNLDQPDAELDATVDAGEAARLANKLTERLTYDPNDIRSREKLARILAEKLSKPALGIEQIELLLGMKDPEDNKRAEWMGLIAAWQLKLLHDVSTARSTLEKLIRHFPNSPQAFAARRRISRLVADEKLQQMRSARPHFKIVPPAAT